MFARFGLAIYHAQCLEKQLALILATKYGLGPTRISKMEFDEILKDLDSRTPDGGYPPASVFPRTGCIPRSTTWTSQLASRQGGTEGRDEAGFRLEHCQRVLGPRRTTEFLEAFTRYCAGGELWGRCEAVGLRKCTGGVAAHDQRLGRMTRRRTGSRDLIPPKVINTLTRTGAHQRHLLQRCAWSHTFDREFPTHTSLQPGTGWRRGAECPCFDAKRQWFGYAMRGGIPSRGLAVLWALSCR